MKKVFVIGGMSESGKSTVGLYLDSRRIKRFKITTFLKSVMDREGATGGFHEWNNRNVRERPEWVRERFSEEFSQSMEQLGIEYCCLESLYGPELGVHLRKVLGQEKVVIVYIDIPLEIRLQRQIIRRNLSSVKEARAYLLPRDKMKEEWRVPQIRDIADVVINNSGTISDLYLQIDAMVLRYCPEFASV